MRSNNNTDKFFFKNKLFSIRYLFFGFLAVIGSVVLFSIPRLVSSDASYLYLRLLLEEPTTRSKVPITYIDKIKKGDMEVNPFPRAEVLSVRYYPTEPLSKSDQYDFILTIKIKLDDTKDKNIVYSFKNTAVKLGSYIELNLPKAHVFGKILDLSENNFNDQYITKTLTLVKVEGYSSLNKNIYEDIVVGDSYFDGEDKVFQVISKDLEDIQPTSWTYDFYQQERGITKNIIIKAKVRLRQAKGYLLFGNNQVVKTNKLMDISTPTNIYEWFEITKVE